MTSVKIVTVDYYLSYPVKDLDVCYSEFRGTEVRQVPVLQIFGSTPEGTKTCLHIHGVLPYIYIPYDGVVPAARMSYQLAAEIDRTLNVALGQASANTCFVHNILLVSGIPLYGYHEREHQYFKIFFYNPMIVKKACSLLENGVILGKHFQPHESHINYVLQFMIDYNLQGMNYIKLSRVMYRMDTENPSSLDAVPREQILPASVQRRSFSRLECDAMARDILNIEEVCSGQLAVNPGLAALWDDERQRRRNNELDSQISFCLTQDRAVPRATATHRVFKQKLREKLANATSVSDVSGRSELEQSVYPAETPTDADLLNASVVLSNETNASAAEPISRLMGGVALSNALTTPSNETNASGGESTSSVMGGAVLSNELTTPSNETSASSVMGQADISVLHLLQDLQANADAAVLEDSVIESSQQEHDVHLLKLLQELREGANVEEDSILSQTVVQHTSDQSSSDDDEEEKSLSLPLVKASETGEKNEFDDDDSVWENSYWDENCEIPQMDGQCDNSSTTSSSSDELDRLPVTPDIAQAVQMAGKPYIVNMADFSVSDSDDWQETAQVSPKHDRQRTNSNIHYYQPENDNCCFPDTAITDNNTQCSVQDSVKLRKANEVYLGQNHRGTLTNSQLLTPGINILKPITPHRITARGRNKIEITEVIINPGLNVSVSRLARDLCTVQIESTSTSDSLPGNNNTTGDGAAMLTNENKTIASATTAAVTNENKTIDSATTVLTNENKTIASAAATLKKENKTIASATAMLTNENKTIASAAMWTNGNKTIDSLATLTNESETNSNPLPSNNTWNTNFTNAMFTNAFRTISARAGNESEQSSKDTEPTASDTGRVKRRRKYPSFTKTRNPRCKTPSFGYRFKKPEHTNAETYDLRSKRTEEPHAESCFGCRAEQERTLGDTYDGCVSKRRRKYRKRKGKIGSKGRKTEDSTTLNENNAMLGLNTETLVNSPGETQNIAVDNTEEFVENGGGDLEAQACEDIPMDLSDPSVINVTIPSGSSCTMRAKRKHAARCEYRMRRFQEFEVSDCSDQEEQTKPAVKRIRRIRQKERQPMISKQMTRLRTLQGTSKKLQNTMPRYDGMADRKKLAMRFRRLHSDISEQDNDSTQSYVCEIIDNSSRNNTANSVNTCSQNSRSSSSDKLAGKDTKNHNFDSLITNVVSIASTAQTTADNMSSVPINYANDDCITCEVTHSANCNNSSRTHTSLVSEDYASSSSSDSDKSTERIQSDGCTSEDSCSTPVSELNTNTADGNAEGGSESSLSPIEVPSSRTSPGIAHLVRGYWKIHDTYNAVQGNADSQRNGSNASPKLEDDESNNSQNELAIRISAMEQPEEELKNKEPAVVDKKFVRWNVDGGNDTLSSSDSSVPKQQCPRVTRRQKLKVDKKAEETFNVSSDSDNTVGKVDVKSVQKQTRSKSKQFIARQQVSSPKVVTKQQLRSPKWTAKQQLRSPKLLTKQLQVNLVPLEFLTTSSKTKSNDKTAYPTKQQTDKTATNACQTLIKSPHKSKRKPTRTSPRFNTLSVTIRSPKSKRHAAEPDLKRIKIVKTREDSSGKDRTMESDSGELQMFGIVPIIQNSNTAKKPQSRSLNSNTTCDIVNQNNNSVPTSIISEPSQCDKARTKVKKQLFSSKPPPRKTIIVNINTDTNTTFVEEHKVCSYEKSARNSVLPKFVQIQRLKDLIAKEEETFPGDTSKMADDTFNFQRPPRDLFEPTCDDSSAKHTADLYSDRNSAANLKHFLESTLAQQHRGITSTSSDSAVIALNDQPVRKTRLDTPYVNNDFSSSDNKVERTPENPRHPEEDEEWCPLICYEDEGELSTAQLYDLKCGFVPQPGTSVQVVTSYVRCRRLRDNEYDREQAAIMQSLVEQHAKKQAECAAMPYDPDCDGEPLVEDCSLPFEPIKELVDSDTLVSSTDDDSLMVNNYEYSVQEVEAATDVEQLETCTDSSTAESSQLPSSYTQLDLNKYDLLTERDETEITNSVQPPKVNHIDQNEDDSIVETTPPKSSTHIFTLLHATSFPNELKTRILMPKYLAPSRQDILNSLAEYNIPECRYQEPFYSNAADVTGKMDVGHNVLKIPSNSIQDLEEFKSCTGFPGLDAWRREKFKQLYPDVDVSKINFRIAFSGQSRVVMLPGAVPPTRVETEQWIEDKIQASYAKEAPVMLPKPRMIIPLSPSGDLDDSMSETMTLTPCTPVKPLREAEQTTPKLNPASLSQRKASGNLQRRVLFSQTMNTSTADQHQKFNLSETSVHNNSHQITGVNMESKVDLQNLQDAKALSEPQNLTIMVVELYVRTRGDLFPDPQYDPVRAIFYSILNDMPAGAELPRNETGVLVVNTLDDTSCRSNLLDGSGVSCEVFYVQSEAELVSTFVQLVRKWDPDICAGYELEMHSWGYLIERCNVLGVNLTSQLSRINPAVVKARTNTDNEQKDVQITGRIILDVWRLLRHEIALQSYTFENIMYHILHRRVPKFSYQRLTFYWEYKRNFHRHITAKYYILRVRSVLQLLEQLDLIGRTSELAKLFGIQFYEVLSRGSQFRVESMMLRLAKPLNYIPVSPSVTQRAKMRAPEFVPLIFEPESRFYADPVIVLDFQSLYPSIIIAYNYCFSTCIGRVELLGSNQPFEFGACQLKVARETLRNLDHKINFSPCGVGFVKPEVRQGILPRMLKEILETRLMVKSSMKENRDNKLLQRVLHSRQLGLKLIANVTYGYTAANFSGRMPCIEVGDSVVSKGRETLERAIKLIEQTPKWRAKVVYGDTDSVFVMVAGRSKQEAFRIGTEIAEAVTNDNPAPVKLKLEKVFLPCILQTKKRYVGYMYESVEQTEPEYCAKGIETVRRDGCPAVAKMLENTLRTLFETRDVSLVKRYVCRQFSKLLTGRVSLQDLTFAREYRGASGYRPGACVPALVLARKWALTDKRREPRRGERVPYVIVNGPPGLPLIRLVRCPRELLADPSRLRPNAVYYITRVIAPALNRCFTLIGADVLAWYNEMPRRQLQQLPTEDSANVKKSTISQYFATTSCASCGQQSRDGLCETCAKDPQQSVVVLYMKINNWERQYDEVSLICESCCSRKTDCSSLDCPVLYRLNQVRRDLRQVPYVRKQIAKFTDD